MPFKQTVWAARGSTALFVLLWSSGAIFAKWGLDYASPFAFLVLRFALALAVLTALGLRTGRCLPAPGTRLRTAATGALLLGGYSICYLLALQHGVTPGVLATVLGVQPLLTLLWLERDLPARRLAGLTLALAGLVLVVWRNIDVARLEHAGMAYALAALACMTAGALLQKGSRQAPGAVLPLQYATSLALCLALAPGQPWQVQWSPGFVATWLWLALVISVAATLLLYRLIQGGNLVNVTSLFYLVPPGTALLDYLLLGNRPAPASLAGMAAIVAGLGLVFGRRRAH
ncbi:EamA-like transporter family protein [Bordetella bronchiseptica MBORD681]|uniref:DMT family transporter n=1 Tax=Bordetella bronchiseptica TaxID=518 RepID=UPI000461109F|nr:DMT family transporter [Bordetella bronchiseptica]KDC57778.1 EamA-like transporter family protein [Bordetella bronchiseptica MBORD595]KDD01486.1 EamA-like transporter family protein [Bordetella bronchiseptica MBORD698]KDD07124.1 EamA-like transporter family protein [Bordetella bronchiseptica MBORD681]VEF43323.1 EamA-like transporter family [Bordetella bronchiseptica]